MVREDLFEKRVAYKSHVGKLYGFGTAESNNVSLDTVLLCDLVVELIEEVKGLRAELKTIEPKINVDIDVEKFSKALAEQLQTKVESTKTTTTKATK